MKKILVILSVIILFFSSAVGTSATIVDYTQNSAQQIGPSLVDTSESTTINDSVVEMKYVFEYSNGITQEVVLTSQEYYGVNTGKTSMPNYDDACTNGTYWFSCDGLKVWTSVGGAGDFQVTMWYFCDISSAVDGTTTISNIQPDYDVPPNTQILEPMTRTISNLSVPFGSTATVEYQMRIDNAHAGETTMRAGLNVNQFTVSVY